MSRPGHWLTVALLIAALSAPARTPASATDTGPTWTLTASTVTLNGCQYRGHATQNVAGRPITTLHFTADRVEITAFTVRGSIRLSGAHTTVATAPGEPVELYVRRLRGTLAVAGYPIAPITLDADRPLPPDADAGFLRLPQLTFHDPVIDGVNLTGGTLSTPLITMDAG
jgi:hypothetical protein